MTPEQIRMSILYAAFQGKLVEQRAEEGDADILYKQCLSDISTAIKQGEIKKQKPLSEITDDDIVFDIPSSWRNIKLGVVSQLIDGEKVKGKEYKYLEVKYLRGNIEAKTVTEGKFAKQGQLVILVDGENSGEVFALPEDGYLGSTFKVLYIVDTLDIDYVLKFFELKRSELRANKKGAAIPHLNKDLLFNYVIPLPPLDEQHRIVAKIEELLPYVDRYAEAYEKLEQFNAKFPEDMKKSILQYAIQGKLVEQRPEEGSAEELYKAIQEEKQKLIKEGKLKKTRALPLITEEEIPFDFPKTWKICYIDDIAFVTKLAGFEYTKYIADNLVIDGIPLFKGKNVQNGKLVLEFESFIPESVSDELPRSQITKKCLLTPYVGTIGNIAIFDGTFKAHLGSNVGKIEILNSNDNTFVLEEYLLWYLRSQYGYNELTKYKKATAQESISIDAIRNVIIAIPPLEEQHRIVAKIEELLSYCDRLVKRC